MDVFGHDSAAPGKSSEKSSIMWLLVSSKIRSSGKVKSLESKVIVSFEGRLLQILSGVLSSAKSERLK